MSSTRFFRLAFKICVIFVSAKMGLKIPSDNLQQVLLLSTVGYVTFFIQLEDFSDRGMVTVTTLLVLATILTGVQDVSARIFKISIM